MHGAMNDPFTFRPAYASGSSDGAPEWWRVTQRSLKTLQKGRRLELVLTLNAPSRSEYAVTVCDTSDGPVTTCAALLVPKGRERDYLFSHPLGQAGLAQDAQYGRMIFVAARPPSSQEPSQQQLSPPIKQLTGGCPNVPYLSIGPDTPSGTAPLLLLRAQCPSGDELLVEDMVADREEESKGRKQGKENSKQAAVAREGETVHRRMVFLSNQGCVQTEMRGVARSVPAPSQQPPASPSRPVSLPGASKVITHHQPPYQLLPDYGHMSASYLHLIIAALSFSQPLSACPCHDHNSSETQPLSAVIVGLGGGALSMFLATFFPCLRTVSLELDPLVAQVAQQYFGVQQSDRLQVVVGDGIKYIKDTAQAPSPSKQHDLLIIDASSSDPSSGLSCPPMPFLSQDFLRSAKQCLKQDGLLVFNLVCRNPTLSNAIMHNILAVFPNTYRLPAEDEVNVVVVCLAGESAPSADELISRARALKQKHGVASCASEKAEKSEEEAQTEQAEKVEEEKGKEKEEGERGQESEAGNKKKKKKKSKKKKKQNRGVPCWDDEMDVEKLVARAQRAQSR